MNQTDQTTQTEMKKGIIYSIKCNVTGKSYIGSTKGKLPARMARHKYQHKLYKNGKFNYITSFDIIENGDYISTILEDVEYNDENDFKQRERYYIENTENTVNRCIIGRTHSEYSKDYYQNHKEEMKTTSRNWYNEHKDEKKDYYNKHKQRIKNYYLEHRDKIIQYQKDRYLKMKIQRERDATQMEI